MENETNSGADIVFHGEVPAPVRLLRLICTVISLITGLLLGSFAFFADGAVSLSSFGEALNGRAKTAMRLIASLAGLYCAVASFFEISLTVGYMKSAVSVFILPFITLVLILKVAVLILLKEGNTGYSPECIRTSGFDLFVTVLVTVTVILSFTVDFYFEPAAATAIGLFIAAHNITGLVKHKADGTDGSL